jgi:hypothetical protein
MIMKKLIALFSLVMFLAVSTTPVVASDRNQPSVELEKKCPKCGKEDCNGKCDVKASAEQEKKEAKSKTAECATTCATTCETEKSKSTTEKQSDKKDKKKEGGR